MNEAKRCEKLLNEAAGYLGMIDEVKAKCLLLKNKLRVAVNEGRDPAEYDDEIDKAVSQMKLDLSRYYRKLEQIYEELQKYGFISNME
jgi:hypothetical protein